MRILVTGHAGFIGRALVDRLLKEGHEVIGLDLNISPPKFGIKQILCDITSGPLMIDYYPDWNKIDYIYHLAAMANLNIADKYPNKCVEVNVMGTNNIVRICHKYKIPLCYISTCCVYGNTKVHPTSEEDLPVPTEIYAITKLMGEYLVRLLPKWTIFRIGTVIGPEMRRALVTHIFLTQAINNKPITIMGTGEQTRAWIYIDDLIDGFVRALELKTNEIINLAGFESKSVNQVADYCYRLVRGRGYLYPVKYLPKRKGDFIREEIDISKAKGLMGWEPKVNVYEAMKRCYEVWVRK